jgi:hypothetical protein
MVLKTMSMAVAAEKRRLRKCWGTSYSTKSALEKRIKEDISKYDDMIVSDRCPERGKSDEVTERFGRYWYDAKTDLLWSYKSHWDGREFEGYWWSQMISSASRYNPILKYHRYEYLKSEIGKIEAEIAAIWAD